MTDIDVDQLEARMLAGLKDKDTRLVCAMGLCSSGKKQFIAPVTGIMETIHWDDVEDLSLALFSFGQPAVPFLIPLIHSRKKSTAACAMRALGRIKGRSAAEALVEQLVTLPTKSEPTEALVMMGTDAIPFLLPLLRQSKADVRAMAAFALGKIGDQAPLKTLQDVAENDKSEKVRGVASHSIRCLLGEEVCTIDLRNSFGDISLDAHQS